MTRHRAFLVGAICVIAIALVVGGVAQATGVFGPTPKRDEVSQSSSSLVAVPLGTLKVFRSPATAEDQAAVRDPDVTELVHALTGEVPATVPEDFAAGTPSLSDLRLALAGLGEAQRAIFVVRTSKGRVCAGLTGFSGGCYQGLPAGVYLDAMAADPDGPGGEPALVWGITRDGVQSVDVVVDGRPYAATIGRNAYFFQLADNRTSADAIQTIVAHLPNGETRSLPVPHAGP